MTPASVSLPITCAVAPGSTARKQPAGRLRIERDQAHRRSDVGADPNPRAEVRGVRLVAAGNVGRRQRDGALEERAVPSCRSRG